MGILIAILGFSILVIGHEFGHYFLARFNKVKVEEFSLGMGPRLFSFNTKNTKWSVKLLPFGGSCQMKGETEEVDGINKKEEKVDKVDKVETVLENTVDEENSIEKENNNVITTKNTENLKVDDDSFQSKSPIRRMSIIAAGPIMNIIMAIILLTIFNMVNGFSTNKVENVIDNSPAKTIGLKKGDKIVEVDGHKTTTQNDVGMYMHIAGGKKTNIVVERDGEKKSYDITPKETEEGQILIGYQPEVVLKPTFTQAVQQSFISSMSLVRQTLVSFKLLATGKVSLNEVGGPITVVRVGSKVAQNSMIGFLFLLGFISINLAVLNLMPFPALDGGWLLILFVELILGKKLNEKFVNYWNTVGFVLLMGLSVLVIFKDIFFPVALK